MMNVYVAGAAMAAWMFFGYWGGRRYEQRRVLVIVGEKLRSMPKDDACCRSALKDIARDIIMGAMPVEKEKR